MGGDKYDVMSVEELEAALIATCKEIELQSKNVVKITDQIKAKRAAKAA